MSSDGEPSQRLGRWADSKDTCISEARVFIPMSYSERVVAMWSRSRVAGGWWQVGVWAEARNSGGRRGGDPGGLQKQEQPHRAHSRWVSNDSVVDVYCTKLLHRCKSPRQSRENRAESFA